MSDKQKSFLKLLITKVYDQTCKTSDSGSETFKKDLIRSLLYQKAQYDANKNGEKTSFLAKTEQLIEGAGESEISTSAIDATETNTKPIDDLNKDELYFCITRVKNDYLITNTDKKRVLIYFSDGIGPNYKPNYHAMSQLLGKDTTCDISDDDYLNLLRMIGHLTFNRIRNFKCDSRDQILVKNDKYEVGYEHYAEIYYIKYYYLFMLDIDSLDDEVLERIERFCQTYPQYLFALYRTTKGYHLFCLSHTINHQTADNVLLQDELHGDPWYTTFSYNYGYKVRMSHKKTCVTADVSNEEGHSDSPYIAKFMRNIGTGKETTYCRNMLDIHDKLLLLDLHYDTPIDLLSGQVLPTIDHSLLR